MGYTLHHRQRKLEREHARRQKREEKDAARLAAADVRLAELLNRKRTPAADPFAAKLAAIAKVRREG